MRLGSRQKKERSLERRPLPQILLFSYGAHMFARPVAGYLLKKWFTKGGGGHRHHRTPPQLHP